MATAGLRVVPSRTEQTIVTARVVLAASSLFAVWLDPPGRDRYVIPAYSLHSIYVIYAISLALASWNRPASGRWPLVTHLGDIAIGTVFQWLSLGPSSSPFFTYFVFSLFCALLRWGWRGTLRTAIVVVALFLITGFLMHQTLGLDGFDLRRYVVRGFYLTVIAGLLMFLGQHEARLRRDIESLSRWPSATGVDLPAALARVLAHAAPIVGAGRALVVWEAGDEPWAHLATWSPAGFAVTRHGPDAFSPIVPPELADVVVLRTAAIGTHSVFIGKTGSYVEWNGLPAHPGLVRLLEGAGLISAPFRTERVAGRVFFTDLTAPTAELMALTGVVAREIGGSLEQLTIGAHLRDLAASEQRLQVARDLHDGVLQSLTGIRLELQDVAADLDPESSEPQRERLVAIERTLAIEQRELRMFINGLKPGAAVRSETSLLASLDALRERIALEWKVPLTIRASPGVAAIPDAIQRAIPPMVHEAVVNALKHGDPSRIRVDVEVERGTLRIIVGDDGHGFPFRGRYDHTALAEARIGPASLRDRAASLGGTLSIESEGSGSRVEITLPLATAGAA